MLTVVHAATWPTAGDNPLSLNPYEPPLTPERLEARSQPDTKLPEALFRRTQLIVRSFGLFQFLWPIAVSPWYVLAFPLSVMQSDATDMRNWLPTRFSPVISMQLLTSFGATASIFTIVNCYRYHRSMRQGLTR